MLEFIANVGQITDIKSTKLLLKFAKESGFNFAKFDAISLPDAFDSLAITGESSSSLVMASDYKDIFKYANYLGISLYASCYDYDAVDMASRHTYICEIPVEKINDREFIRYVSERFQYVIIRTDNCDLDLIEELYYSFGPHLIMFEPVNTKDKLSGLTQIKLGNLYTGYSDNNDNPIQTIVAATQGVSYIEKPVTLDRNLFGNTRTRDVIEPTQFKTFIDKVKYARSLI